MNHSDHAFETMTDPRGDRVEIDIKLVPLIKSLWKKGIDTEMCCQDTDGKCRITFPDTDECQKFVLAILENSDVRIEVITGGFPDMLEPTVMWAPRHTEKITDIFLERL